ncbi:MAG: crossover junction endodeoxyribonuclease RuvC [Candidatus Puniceispirillum sp.]|jgi:crossover junction endodeoxyribonuclease RuvC|uniref:crossover junction endodeoxyribonuclease RuvC n=1 Tax=Candidatus Puniceispirillum sp. TaxID=2026719 RepID=UPI001EB44455|nr:crossover junction endodeoxyribonuclease RuvC [Candidatus Puniceispirillum sp.]MBT6414627.1 crossover junction endodeoxyribonuclease RuvC [Candidatus Puniceispirillum sp.]MBT6566381.1 crossover junction endodeoxyribonuclease RuvC [Candidatus Puniceispirillum sp.]
MRVLGIDPGLRATGWGVIDVAGGRLSHIANGVIKPSPTLPDTQRLCRIADDLLAVIEAHRPTRAAIEEIFVAKSAKSALRLGMARGVAIMICGQTGLEVHELAARLVKKSITGTGTADKIQIQDMVSRLLGVTPANADAADALAIAIAASNGAGLGIADDAGKAASVRVGSTGNADAKNGLSQAIAAALARDAQDNEGNP